MENRQTRTEERKILYVQYRFQMSIPGLIPSRNANTHSMPDAGVKKEVRIIEDRKRILLLHCAMVKRWLIVGETL